MTLIPESSSSLDDSPVKKNLLCLWSKVDCSKEWQIKKSNHLLALKAPTKMPYFNLCWGVQTTEELKEVQDFFTPHTFCLLHHQITSFSFPITSYFQSSIDRIDMGVDLKSFNETDYNIPITIKRLEKSEWKKFSLFLSNNNKNLLEDAKNAIQPIFKHCSFYLAYMHDEPIGRAMYHIDDHKTAAIYLIQVSESYRGRGIGRKLTLKCLIDAKAEGAERVTISAPPTGWKLCQKLNFTNLTLTYSLRISKSSHF